MEQTAPIPGLYKLMLQKGGLTMKKNPPRKTGPLLSPERKAEFFNGLALYMREYKRKLIRKSSLSEAVSRAS